MRANKKQYVTEKFALPMLWRSMLVVSVREIL